MVRGLRRLPTANITATGEIYHLAGEGEKDGLISKYRTIPLNSLARQEEDLHLLTTAAPTVTKHWQNAGLTTVNPDLNAMPVKVDEWLASPASEGWRLLWLTLENGASGVLVPVEGLK